LVGFVDTLYYSQSNTAADVAAAIRAAVVFSSVSVDCFSGVKPDPLHCFDAVGGLTGRASSL